MRATWYISGAPMKVLKWSPEFYPNIESPVVPVWVGLPGLPLHFFEKSALFCIASVLGTPLKIDEPTAKLTRPTVARICVEVDVSKPRHRRIWLGDEKDGYWQDVVFENPPQYCDFCKVLGHEISTCYRKNPELLKELKKDSDIDAEKNRSSGLPAVSVEMDKQTEIWRRKKVETDKEEPKDAEGWIVVGEKKQNKIKNSTSKEKTEMTAVAKKMKRISSEIKVQEEVKRQEEVGGKNKGTTAGQTNKPHGPTAIMVKTVTKPLISKNLSPANKEKEGSVTEEMSIQKTFASEIPVKEVAGVVYPAISTYGFKPSETLKMAVALTPFPDLAKLRKKMGVGNEESSGSFLLQERNRADPSSKVQTMVQNPPSNFNESEQDAICLQKGTAHVSATDGTSEKRDGKALVLAENEIHPLDCSIDLQPSMHSGMSSGPKFGASEVGCQLGPKGRGNLGFEYFKGSSPADIQSNGLNSVCGLGQLVDCVGGNGKEQPGPSAAGPELLIPEEMGLSYCQLNKNASQPSTQSNFNPNITSEDNPSDEDEENNSSEDSDYFGTYHSDGDFLEDSDWYSEDSETAKFLKGKWRRGYTLRANISRRSLD